MSQARDFADSFSAVSTGRRNMIINGAMQVDQRNSGSSSSVSSSSTHYMADRFGIIWPSLIDDLVGDIQQVSDAPDGFSNSIKWTTTTPETAIATDEYVYIDTKIEAQNLQHLQYGTSSAKSITLSFYVKSSQTGTFGVSLYCTDGNRNIGSTYTIDSADAWEYKTVTFVGDTAGTINDDNGDGMRVVWHLATGSTYDVTDNTSWGAYAAGRWGYGHAQDGVITTDNATWQLTGVQLELGNSASPFEHRSFGEEFSLCERYYQRWNGNSLGTGAVIGVGAATGTSSAYAELEHRPMRTIPTIGFSNMIFSDSVTYDKDVSAVSITTGSYSNGRYYASITAASGMTAYRPGNFRFKSSTSGYFEYDAEL